jgi:hypothetical protein
MIANILIAVLSFGLGAFFGAYQVVNNLFKAYAKSPVKVIDLFDKYEKKLNSLNGLQN